MTKRELVREIRRGSREAAQEIAEKYYDDIYRFSRYLTGHAEDSYDITQEVFLRFFRYAEAGFSGNLKGYLLTIARNLCRDYFRKQHEALSLEQAEDVEQPNSEMHNAENALVLLEALQELPLEQREVLVLRYYQELRFGEIARIQGCSVSTAKSRHRLGVESMRRKFGRTDV